METNGITNLSLFTLRQIIEMYSTKPEHIGHETYQGYRKAPPLSARFASLPSLESRIIEREAKMRPLHKTD